MTTPFRLPLGKVLPLAILATSVLVSGLRGATAETGDNFRVNAVDRSQTEEMDISSVPKAGDLLQPGQRIETVPGQRLQLTIGRNTIAFAPGTVMIVGDDDPSTPVGTFQLISGAVSVTVRTNESATIDTPRLKASSNGADFIVRTTDKISEVSVMGGAVRVASLETGASTDVGAKMVAIVGRKDLNDRARQSDPVVLALKRTTGSMAIAQSGNDPSGRHWISRMANQAWVIKFEQQKKATPIWVVTNLFSSAGLSPDGKSTLDALPNPGTVLAAGMTITTGPDDHVQMTNGRDLVILNSNTTIVTGDADPATAEPDLKLVSGEIDVQVSGNDNGQPIVIGAPYLSATLENAYCIMTAKPTKSSSG